MLQCVEKDDCIKVKRETTCQAKASCYRAVKRSKKSTCQLAGCFDGQLMEMYCKNKINEQINYNGTTIVCCNQENFCNKINSRWYDNLNDYAFYVVVVSLFVSIACLIYSNKCKFRKKFKTKKQPDELSIVIEKSFYKQITLIENIGEGRFGTVFKGIYYDRLVAVKIFKSNDYDSYKRELEIYKFPSLSRESILKCIGWDTALVDFSTEYWLVLDFCELGSLYDYLQVNILDKDQLLSIILSAITGLNHLHDTQEFTISKPGVAHRDLKSKNLLMKSDRTVCIADFGLSLKSIEIYPTQSIKIQVGTKRYFAPEILNETLNIKLFQSFALADIYSFSLVLWESLNRSKFNDRLARYRLPYYEYTDNDPSVEEMRNVVVVDGRRPKLMDEIDDSNYDPSNRKVRKVMILDDVILDSLCKIIRNCWQQNPSNRLNSLQIKEKLDHLCAMMKGNKF